LTSIGGERDALTCVRQVHEPPKLVEATVLPLNVRVRGELVIVCATRAPCPPETGVAPPLVEDRVEALGRRGTRIAYREHPSGSE